MYNSLVGKSREDQAILKGKLPGQGEIRAEESNKEWKESPYDFVGSGYRDFQKAINAQKAKQKEKSVQNDTSSNKFEMKFRSARKEGYTAEARKKNCKTKNSAISIYPQSFRKELKNIGSRDDIWIECSEKLPDEMPFDARIRKDRRNRFYLHLPLHVRKEKPIDMDRARVIALDPGIRTFQTGYDPDGKVLEFGAGNFKRIRNLAHQSDLIQSRISTETRKKYRERLSRARYKLLDRIHNLVEEVHKKTVRVLDDMYDFVFLPSFDVKEMTKRKNKKRKLNKKTTRSMVTWAHYRFKQRMINHFGDRCMIVGEEYTSKTCGHCGTIDNKLQGKKVFNCKACGCVMGRDVNGARNIFLKNMTLLKSGLCGRELPLGAM